MDLYESEDALSTTTVRTKLFVHIGMHGILSLLSTIPVNLTDELLPRVARGLPFASMLRFDLYKTYLETKGASKAEDFDYTYSVGVRLNDQ